MDVEQTAINIRDAIQDVPKRYADNLDKIERYEKELLDIQHQLELTKFNAYEGYKIAKEQQKILKERRELKDENELLKHLQPILSGMKNKVKGFNEVIGEIRQSKANLEKRSYRCRVRKDLQSKINGVK